MPNPEFLTSWGWQSAGIISACARRRPGRDPGALPAWERRNIADQVFGNQRYNPGDEQDWRSPTSADIHLGEAQDAPMTPGNDGGRSHLRHHRLPHPRHGLRQLHQPRHRSRQPARRE
jgi:hypothetical protein